MTTDQDFQENCWNAMPLDLKQRAVDHIKANLTEDQLRQIREWHEEFGSEWATADLTPPDKKKEQEDAAGFSLPFVFHMGAGMGIRNLLREVIKDEELPDARGLGWPDYDDSPEPVRNWDDFYTQVLEAAAGIREMEATAP